MISGEQNVVMRSTMRDLLESPILNKCRPEDAMLPEPPCNSFSNKVKVFDSIQKLNLDDNSNDSTNENMTSEVLPDDGFGADDVFEMTNANVDKLLSNEVDEDVNSQQPAKANSSQECNNNGAITLSRKLFSYYGNSSHRALAMLNAIQTKSNKKYLSPSINNLKCDESLESDLPSRSQITPKNNFEFSPPRGGEKSRFHFHSQISRGSRILLAAQRQLSPPMGSSKRKRGPEGELDVTPSSSNGSPSNQPPGILRKSNSFNYSPLNSDGKSKRRKVLFAEPPVSSEIEIEPRPGASPRSRMLPLYVKRRTLIHQSHTFDESYLESTSGVEPDIVKETPQETCGMSEKGEIIFEESSINPELKQDKSSNGVVKERKSTNCDIETANESPSEYVDSPNNGSKPIQLQDTTISEPLSSETPSGDFNQSTTKESSEIEELNSSSFDNGESEDKGLDSFDKPNCESDANNESVISSNQCRVETKENAAIENALPGVASIQENDKEDADKESDSDDADFEMVKLPPLLIPRWIAEELYSWLGAVLAK